MGLELADCYSNQVFCYISSKKQYKTKQINSLGPKKIVCYIRYFVISYLFISSFHRIPLKVYATGNKHPLNSFHYSNTLYLTHLPPKITILFDSLNLVLKIAWARSIENVSNTKSNHIQWVNILTE